MGLHRPSLLVAMADRAHYIRILAKFIAGEGSVQSVLVYCSEGCASAKKRASAFRQLTANLNPSRLLRTFSTKMRKVEGGSPHLWCLRESKRSGPDEQQTDSLSHPTHPQQHDTTQKNTAKPKPTASRTKQKQVEKNQSFF